MEIDQELNAGVLCPRVVCSCMPGESEVDTDTQMDLGKVRSRASTNLRPE